MKLAGKALGYLLFLGAGLILYALGAWFCYQWWGVGWCVAYLLVPPVCEVFPFLLLCKAGFSAITLLFFGIWAVGMAGLVVAGSSNES